ncbi:hypothetical protein [Ensifer adhaerens]|uniref:hypothetical protein n=1 Tax=Ensifer adhaerens TaxID=106592 RepID=UPI000CF02634|nr:hypothetical protein [Ensifer adhaerens]
MNLQALVDAMNEASSRERGNYHLTLGALVEALSAAEPEAIVVFDFDAAVSPSAPESYRGYYSDLSFPPASSPITAGELLKEARDAIGNTFEGYKGGDFTMHDETPLWASAYGSASGIAIMGMTRVGDRYVLTTKQID